MERLTIRGAPRVRRKLFLAALFGLGGVCAAAIEPELYGLGLGLCALLALAGMRARRSDGALLLLLAALLCLCYGMAGRALCLRDEATPSGVRLVGRVKRIVSEKRVILERVTVDGERSLLRPAAVTLMLEEDEVREAARVGQWVEGTGRLFEQQAATNPGQTDARIQALCDGYDLSGYILPGWTLRGEAVFSLGEAFREAREAALALLERVFGEDAALYQAILLADRGALESDVVRSMRLTGTAHILAVSGMHLSLLAGALHALLARLTKRPRLRAAIKIALLTLYTGLTGCAPGTVRALIMAALRELAPLRGRRYDALTALAAAALLMTLINPVWPLNGSFQFSFFVVLGVLLLGRECVALAEKLRRGRMSACLGPLARMAGVSVSAQLAALPVQLMFYGYVPLLALPMNLAAGVLMPALMGIGALCAAAGAIYLPLGARLAGVLALPGRAFERACVAAASLRGGILRLPAPYPVLLALAAALMALGSGQIAWRRRTRRLAPALAALMLLLYLPRFCPAARYVQLDVGQGDAAVLRSGRHAVLVDIGGEDSYAVLRYLRHEGLTVDLVVLSHLDEDHAGALGSLLSSEIEIPALAMPERAVEDCDAQTVLDALETARGMGLPVRELTRGDSFELLGASFNVLSPHDALSGSNERSLLLDVSMRDVRLLLTGDLPASSEPEAPPDCDILKVAHHGSKYATSDAFLAKARPELALISAGAHNSYGHPTQRVLDSLDAAGAMVYRTDTAGCITVWLRDGAWRVRTFLNPRAS